MTYNAIVDRFKEVVRDHNQLQDFGYGNLSDIKTRSEGGTTTNTDYPYLFLNQGIHNRSQQSITYNFNMIVMDIAKDDNFVKIQSECQQYIDDVLARLRFHYKDQVDINISNITLTPFKERFQDTVAGMTATISIEVPQPLNECIAPFETIEPEVDPIYSAEITYPDYSDTYFQTIQVFSPFLVDAQVIDTDYVTETGYIRIEPTENINVTVSVDITLKNLIDQAVIDAQPGDVWTDIDGALYLFYDIIENSQAIPVPVQQVDLDFSKAIDEEYTINVEFTLDLNAGVEYWFRWLGTPFTDALEQVALFKNFKYQVFLNEVLPPVIEPVELYETNITSATNEACDNGVAEFRVRGGVAPYTLTINNQTYNGGTESGWIIQTTLPEGTFGYSLTDSQNTNTVTGDVTINCTYVPPTGCTPVVDVESSQSQGFDPDIGESPIVCSIIHLTDGGWREDVPGVGGNYYRPQTLGPYTWTITGTVLVETTGDTLRTFTLQDTSSGIFYTPTEIIGWPETVPPIGTEFSFELTYVDVVPTNTSNFTIVIAKDFPEEQVGFALLTGTRIQICLQD